MKPYAKNQKKGTYLENTFLDRKAEKIDFGLQPKPFYCIFFLLKSMNLEQINPILINMKSGIQSYNSFCFLHFDDNPSPLSSVVAMFLLCFLIDLFFSCK